ncbi:hypothetical protein FQN57_001227 [Myotisia sp. PD_48]|nr:hypothetical protein FQN57_001227 [Myotisia sp. PD_48]
MAAEPKGQQPTVCVFCGAAPGNSPAYLAAARDLAHLLHKEGITLVYGGGTAGIMGELARTLVSLAGPQSVHGIIPSALVSIEDGHKSSLNAAPTETSSLEVDQTSKEPERVIVSPDPANTKIAMYECFENSEYGMTTIVPDMHTRKRLMAEKVIAGGPGSGFLVLPGGFGTLEEAMEMVTWNQLGIHGKGIVLLNIEGYWDGILSWLNRSVEEGFVGKVNKNIMVECKDVEHTLEALRSYRLSEGRFGLDWTVPARNDK